MSDKTEDNKPDKEDDALCASRDFDKSKSSNVIKYEFNNNLNTLLEDINKLLKDNNVEDKQRIKLSKDIIKVYYKVNKYKDIKNIIKEYIKEDNNINEEEIKEKRKEYNKKWREEHKDKIKEYNKKNQDKDKIKEYQKNYYDKHPDKLEEIKEKRRLNSKEYYNKNKINILKKMKVNYNNKKINNNKENNKELNNLI